jgi:hypothetical protein
VDLHLAGLVSLYNLLQLNDRSHNRESQGTVSAAGGEGRRRMGCRQTGWRAVSRWL